MTALNAQAFSALLDLSDGSPAWILEVVAVFRHDAARRIDTIARHHRAGDLVATRAAAHALLGSSLNVGASELARLADRVRDDAHHPHRLSDFSARMMFEALDAFERAVDEALAHPTR